MIGDFFEKMFLWPFFGGITTVFGVIAGFLGAHYEKEIAFAFLPFFIEGYVFSQGATIFWLTALAFGACFTGTFWAQARSTARASTKMMQATENIDGKTDALAARAGELKNLVRQLYTLPPVGFLEAYRQIIISSETAYEEARSQALNPETLAFVIRTQLLWVLKLIQEFDEDGKTAQYGVNIMLYRNSSCLSPAALKALDDRIRFVEKGVSVNKLDGVLDLICEFSVSSESGSAVDPNLSPFALPIPVLNEEERKARMKNGVLPGAPDAFTSLAECVIETPEIWTALAGTDHFSPPLRRELSSLFSGASTWMQSFISIPLYERDWSNDAEKSTPIAVLNIHRNLPYKLGAEKYQLLSPLLLPVTLTIERFLWTYSDLLPEIGGIRK